LVKGITTHENLAKQLGINFFNSIGQEATFARSVQWPKLGREQPFVEAPMSRRAARIKSTCNRPQPRERQKCAHRAFGFVGPT
jgi:hypothetical protein